FQAEDGIRDATVTGVQTCALPISFNEDSDKDDLEIVGVIGDAKYDSAKEKADRTVYQPILQVQDQQTYNNVLELRTAGDPSSFRSEERRVGRECRARYVPRQETRR